MISGSSPGEERMREWDCRMQDAGGLGWGHGSHPSGVSNALAITAPGSITGAQAAVLRVTRSEDPSRVPSFHYQTVIALSPILLLVSH